MYLSKAEERRHKHLENKKRKELAEHIAGILRAGGSVEFGNFAFIVTGNFQTLIVVNFLSGGIEESFTDFSNSTVCEALKFIGK